MVVGVAELLSKVDKEPNQEKRIEMLRQSNSAALQMFFQYALDPRVIWLLPETNPPYRPTEFLDQQGAFWQNIRKLARFCKGGDDNLPQPKREQMFISLLEILDPEDAKLLLAAKNKFLPYKNVTYDLIKKAFPSLDFLPPGPPRVNPEGDLDKTIKPEDQKKKVNKKAEISNKEVKRKPGQTKPSIWITDGVVDQKVPADYEIPENWRRGRTFAFKKK